MASQISKSIYLQANKKRSDPEKMQLQTANSIHGKLEASNQGKPKK